MWLVIPVLLTAHVLVCLLMVAVTLMQLPRSEGLGAAFGGGVTENLFGAQTTNVLTKFTVWLGMAFFVITLLLAFAYANDGSTGSKIEKELLASPQPSAAPAASPLASPAAEPSPSLVAPQPAQPVPSPVAPEAASGSAAPAASLDIHSGATADAPAAPGSLLDGTSNPLDIRKPAPSPSPAAP